MAECTGQKALALQLKWLHIHIESFHFHIVRSRHLTAFSRKAQASLISGLFSAGLDNLGIDQNMPDLPQLHR